MSTNNNNNYRSSSSYRSGPSSLPPFINDLAEEEITAKKFGPRDKRKARLFMNNNTGEISKFGPVTQPLQQGDKFIMPVAREVRSSFSMLSDPEEAGI
jgi:hypothetical protein